MPEGPAQVPHIPVTAQDMILPVNVFHEGFDSDINSTVGNAGMDFLKKAIAIYTMPAMLPLA